jgi:hypothetical protein
MMLLRLHLSQLDFKVESLHILTNEKLCCMAMEWELKMFMLCSMYYEICSIVIMARKWKSLGLNINLCSQWLIE